MSENKNELLVILEKYINDNYKTEENVFYFGLPTDKDPFKNNRISQSLKVLLDKQEMGFADALREKIIEKRKANTEVYKKANIDPKLFSKIMTVKDHHPKKTTVLSLCIGLELSLEETKDLLNKAGYSLSNSNKADIIIQYFIENKIYDIFIINETLYEFDEPCLF